MARPTWREVANLQSDKNHLCEVTARKPEDALVMEVHDRGRSC